MIINTNNMRCKTLLWIYYKGYSFADILIKHDYQDRIVEVRNKSKNAHKSYEILYNMYMYI